MTRITQISAAALLAVFASTAFVPVANAHGKKVWCKQASAKVFRTSCEEFVRKRPARYPTFQPVVRVQNFRGADIVVGPSGSGNNGNGGQGGANGGGAAGGRP
ncbi:hypothetical protein MNBD_ALPHA08-1383 [hydrothermal vent metagenome]|uniref:Uncharacterized protein n=1 Tax=hydrothermal vent metagenome TaxID=652676 RepID=A0A3B0SC53_9ZZZZ